MSTLLLLAGCGFHSASAHRAALDAASAQDAPEVQAAADPMANMVSAVGPAAAVNPVSVKFRIESRPMVGMPLKIMLAVIPDADADADIARIHGALLPGDGLALQSDRSFDLSSLQNGTALFREVTVVPQQTGVLNLSATLLLETDKTSEARTYSIPVIATDNSGS